MISTPFILFYAIGMILQSGLDYLIKLFAFVSLYVAIYFANNYVYDERLNSVLPMSTYLATKVNDKFLFKKPDLKLEVFFCFILKYFDELFKPFYYCIFSFFFYFSFGYT